MLRQLALGLLFSMVVAVLSDRSVLAGEEKPTLRVAVASNFLLTAKVIARDFEQQTGIRVLLSSASSGKITTQIEAGAPYDLFLSADTARPERLISNGFAYPDSFAVYAIGSLVLVGRNAISDPIQFNDQRLAIANPKIAPYGLAAQNWLNSRNLTPKLILGENINQAWHFFQVGAVPYAIVAKAQLMHSKNKPPHSKELLVDNATLAQGMVILTRTKNPTTARQFHAYLMSEVIQQKIQNAGYRVKVGSK